MTVHIFYFQLADLTRRTGHLAVVEPLSSCTAFTSTFFTLNSPFLGLFFSFLPQHMQPLASAAIVYNGWK